MRIPYSMCITRMKIPYSEDNWLIDCYADGISIYHDNKDGSTAKEICFTSEAPISLISLGNAILIQYTPKMYELLLKNDPDSPLLEEIKKEFVALVKQTRGA